MIKQFRIKLVLAAVSGALVSLSDIVCEWLPVSNEWLDWLLGYGVPGTLFAVAVLWPYLKRDRSFYFRGAALIASSVLSYWCAYQTAMELGWDGPTSRWEFEGDFFIIASFFGVVIVLLAVKLLIPLRWSLVYVLLGLVASVLGGLVFVWFSNDESWLASMIPYALWHSIVCAAIHFGSPSTEDGSRLYTALMPKFKIPLVALSALLLLLFADAVFHMYISWYP